ncbi:Serralysin C precursor [Gracilaria domingensis]|nr:Serralysin C precursor [Gracilaria domingensis]
MRRRRRRSGMVGELKPMRDRSGDLVAASPPTDSLSAPERDGDVVGHRVGTDRVYRSRLRPDGDDRVGVLVCAAGRHIGAVDRLDRQNVVQHGCLRVLPPAVRCVPVGAGVLRIEIRHDRPHDGLSQIDPCAFGKKKSPRGRTGIIRMGVVYAGGGVGKPDISAVGVARRDDVAGDHIVPQLYRQIGAGGLFGVQRDQPEYSP